MNHRDEDYLDSLLADASPDPDPAFKDALRQRLRARLDARISEEQDRLQTAPARRSLSQRMAAWIARLSGDQPARPPRRLHASAAFSMLLLVALSAVLILSVVVSPEPRISATQATGLTQTADADATPAPTATRRAPRQGVSCFTYAPLVWDLGAQPGPIAPETYRTRVPIRGTVPITPHNAAAVQQLTYFAGHAHWLSGVRFSPDGSLLIAEDETKQTIFLWRVITGEEVAMLPCGSHAVFTNLGNELVTANSGGLLFWEMSTGHRVGELATAELSLNDLDYSPAANAIVAATGRLNQEGSVVYEWDGSTGAVLHAIPVEQLTRSAAISPDGSVLAAGTLVGKVMLWDTTSGAELAAVPAHRGSIYALAFSPDGRVLASAGGDNAVHLWDSATGEPVLSLIGHEEWVLAVTFSPDGTLIATSGRDGSVRLWDAATGQQLTVLASPATPGKHVQWVTGVAFSPDGMLLAASRSDGRVQLWSISDPG